MKYQIISQGHLYRKMDASMLVKNLFGHSIYIIIGFIYFSQSACAADNAGKTTVDNLMTDESSALTTEAYTTLPPCTITCHNGGTCYFENGIAKCKCTEDYDGNTCENYMPSGASAKVIIPIVLGVILLICICGFLFFKWKKFQNQQRRESSSNKYQVVSKQETDAGAKPESV